ncbi:hypothetical protein [Sinorhizobium medicae]
MADRPILFSAPMVRALLDGRKTQTRRLCKDQPPAGVTIIRKTIRPFGGEPYHAFERRTKFGNFGGEVPVKISRGDRLWVREHWCTEHHYDDLSPSEMGGEEPIKFKADGALMTHGFPAMQRDGRHRQAMHMPRWASRLTLIVSDVRVERLQDISESDTRAEGVEPLHQGWFPYGITTFMTTISNGREVPAQYAETASASYRMLWDSINGRGAWEANPWVAAYTFTVIKDNIDRIAA